MYYFTNCSTLDQAKDLFRKLCIQLHPDTSGYDSNGDFIKMYQEFENFNPFFKKDSDQGFDSGKFYNLIKKFDNIQGVEISFVGSFIWIEDLEPQEDYTQNATYQQKEELKSISIDGLKSIRYASKKKAWYFSPEDYKQKHRSRKSLDQIKDTWGCKTFYKEGNRQLA